MNDEEKEMIEKMKKVNFKENISLFNIKNYIIDALNTDGGHHKQWYLEEILKEILLPERYIIIQDRYDWEEGIPP